MKARIIIDADFGHKVDIDKFIEYLKTEWKLKSAHISDLKTFDTIILKDKLPGAIESQIRIQITKR